MSAAGEHERSTKRRKTVRKGTHSCWACKRLKSKCSRTGNQPSTYVCHGCKRRGTKCVGQEFPEDDVTTDSQELPNRGVTISDPVVATQQEDHPLLSTSLPTRADLELIRTAIAQTADTYCNHLTGHAGSKITLDRIDVNAIDAVIQDIHASDSQPHKIARVLLQIAIFLQDDETLTPREMASLSEPKMRIGERCARAATFIMSIHEEVFEDYESLQCAVLQSIYRSYNGHLKRALFSCRKAVLVAQGLGLPFHGSDRSHELDRSGSVSIQPGLKELCSYAVRQDLLMSRALGIQPGVFETSSPNRGQAADMTALEDLHLDIMARLAKYRLLMSRPPDFEKVSRIDQELQAATRAMPKDWWLVPDMTKNCGEDSCKSCNVRRLNAQMVHFDLRIRLYVPHMSCSPGKDTTRQQTCLAQEACIRASREVLSRSVLMQSFHPQDSGMQIPDFLGVMAAITLLLAHMSRPETALCCSAMTVGMSSNDRIMIMQTIRNLQHLQPGGGEPSVQQLVTVLKYLLETQSSGARHKGEDPATERELYQTEDQSSAIGVASLGHDKVNVAKPSSTSDCAPYFGAIDILFNKDKVGQSQETGMTQAGQDAVSDEERPGQEGYVEHLPTGLRNCLLNMHSVDIAFVNRLSGSCLR